jgi:hypothetical protein
VAFFFGLMGILNMPINNTPVFVSAVVINKEAEKPETQHTPVAQIEVGAGKKLLKSFLLSENY